VKMKNNFKTTSLNFGGGEELSRTLGDISNIKGFRKEFIAKTICLIIVNKFSRGSMRIWARKKQNGKGGLLLGLI